MTPISVAQKWGSSLSADVEGVNVVDVNPRHGLWSFGLDGGGGVVEFWDPRSRSALTRLNLPTSTLLPAQMNDTDSLAPIKRMAITALASHPTDGLSMAVGTSSGHTLLYDLRSPTPFAVKDQGYGEPIRTVDWIRGGGAQEDAGRVISADSKVIKVWSRDEVSFECHVQRMYADESAFRESAFPSSTSIIGRPPCRPPIRSHPRGLRFSHLVILLRPRDRSCTEMGRIPGLGH